MTTAAGVSASGGDVIRSPDDDRWRARPIRPAWRLMQAMGWSERQSWFERLLALRAGYPQSDDRTGVLSVADAIRYVEAVMSAAELDDEPWQANLDEADPGARQEPAIDLSREHRFASDLWPWPNPSTLGPSPDRRDAESA
jgi:hypothetical protein